MANSFNCKVCPCPADEYCATCCPMDNQEAKDRNNYLDEKYGRSDRLQCRAWLTNMYMKYLAKNED